MNSIKQIISRLKYFQIESQRLTDHFLRFVTGSPQIKRSQITPQIYLGGQLRPPGIRLLKKWGITAIISLRQTPPLKYITSLGLRSLHLPTPDLKAPSLEHIEAGINFIQNEIDQGGKVYIHCHYGEGRGPTMALAYLMNQGLSLEDALKLVKKSRSFISLTRPQVLLLTQIEAKKTKNDQ